MKLEEAYRAAREKLGMPQDEFFDDEDWREETFRRHAVGGILAGMREFPESVEDGESLLGLFDRLELSAVARMIDACFQAAVVRTARDEEPSDECSGRAVEYILRDTYGNAYERAVGVLESEDEEELAKWATEQVGWLAKGVGCEPD